MQPFESQADLVQKLDGTICYHKDVPVYVRAYNDGIKNEAVITPLNDKFFTYDIDVTDDSFRNGPYRLGYLNYDDQCLFVQRRPQRQYKFGLAAKALSFKKPKGGVKLAHLFPWSLDRMLRGSYPSIDEALKYMREYPFAQSKAFDRDYCFQRIDEKIIGIFYKELCLASSTTGDKFYLMDHLPYASFHAPKLQQWGLINNAD